MKTVKISKTSGPLTTVNVKVCDTFFSKFIGLMFSREIKPENGIIIVEKTETRINTTIHMMFMNYDITALWLDKEMVVVDKALAKKWKLVYCPKKPAQFVVEIHSSKFSEYAIGDRLIMLHENQVS